MQQLKGGFYQLIQFIFPEIEFDNTKFQSANSMFSSLLLFFPSLSFIYFYILRTIVIISFFSFYAEWLDIESRRRFFEAYANENKFDPLIAENWYMQSYSQFFSENVTPPSPPLLSSFYSFVLSLSSALPFVIRFN